MAKLLAIVPLLSAVESCLCRVIRAGKDLWRSVDQPPPLTLRLNQAAQGLSWVRAEALQGWRYQHLSGPMCVHLPLYPNKVSPLATHCLILSPYISISNHLCPTGAMSISFSF